MFIIHFPAHFQHKGCKIRLTYVYCGKRREELLSIMIYNSEKHIENKNISTYVSCSKSWVDGESRDDSIVVEQLQVADKNHEYHFTYTLLL